MQWLNTIGISGYHIFFLPHSESDYFHSYIIITAPSIVLTMCQVYFTCIISFNKAYEVCTFIIPLRLIRKLRKGFAQGHPTSLSQAETPVLELQGQQAQGCPPTQHIFPAGEIAGAHRETFGFFLASLTNLPSSGTRGPRGGSGAGGQCTHGGPLPQAVLGARVVGAAETAKADHLNSGRSGAGKGGCLCEGVCTPSPCSCPPHTP